MEAEAVRTIPPAVQKLSAGEWDPERFRRHLAKAGVPPVERVGDDEVEVTFIDEPGSDTTTRLSVVIGLIIGRNTIDEEFAAVPGTPFRVLTLRMRSDLRFGYVFTRRGPTGEDEQVPDPFNPPPPFSEYSEPRFSGSSVLTLPDAEPLPWLDWAEARPALMPEPSVLVSEILGNERRIWVSMPPGEASNDRPLPLVIQLDGTPEHSAPSVRDALVEAGVIRPCAVVLVDQLGSQRYEELLCSAEFSRMLVEELLPVAPQPVPAVVGSGRCGAGGRKLRRSVRRMDGAASSGGVRQRHSPVAVVRLPPRPQVGRWRRRAAAPRPRADADR